MAEPLHILILQRDLPVEWDVLATVPPGCVFHAATTVEEAAGWTSQARVVVVGFGGGGLLRQLWPRFTQLAWVHSMSAGLDWFMFDALRDSSVPLTNAAGVYARALAEFAMLGLLHFAKDVPRLMAQHQAHVWQPFLMEQLRGTHLTIVGYGGIGRATAQLANAFGMDVTAIKRHPAQPDACVRRVLPPSSLPDALRTTDHVVLCLPHTGETVGLVGEAALACLRPHSVLVNVGRGTAVDERALLDALTHHRIRGAALDVFETEPLPPQHPFFSTENVLLSPHCADRHARWQVESAQFLVDNVARFVTGLPLRNVVNKTLGY